MTSVDLCFEYGAAPGPEVLKALDALRQVYGIRRLGLDPQRQAVRVEYDATRLNAESVAGLLRRAGLQLK